MIEALEERLTYTIYVASDAPLISVIHARGTAPLSTGSSHIWLFCMVCALTLLETAPYTLLHTVLDKSRDLVRDVVHVAA